MRGGGRADVLRARACRWDYGYQITAMGNRTIIVDNNTWNNTHIATVGRAMASNETEAYKIMRRLDVDYVLVIFGGLSGYSSDDINKFLWMVREDVFCAFVYTCLGDDGGRSFALMAGAVRHGAPAFVLRAPRRRCASEAASTPSSRSRTTSPT